MNLTTTFPGSGHEATRIIQCNKRWANYKILRTVIIMIILQFLPGKHSLFAQWSTNPAVNNAICVQPGDQNVPDMISDGAGGAIITWYDLRSGNDYDIYAQRISAAGIVQWTLDGVAICNEINDQVGPRLAPDGKGGAIITWLDARDGISTHVYAQRINAAGVPQWATNGVVICDAINSQGSANIVPDGVGGAVISFSDRRNGAKKGPDDLYAQRVDSSGITQWITNGVAICTQAASQANPSMVTDGAGGAIITWMDDRNGNGNDVFAQRINSSGIVQWTTDGVTISAETDDQLFPLIVNDGAGGAVITWIDKRSGNDFDVYAQQINAAGTIGWAANGVAVCTATGNQFHSAITSDGSGGAIITWDDGRSGTSLEDIYVQRINAAGITQWMADGVAICNELNRQIIPAIVSDGSGGAIITWMDDRDLSSDVYAQKVNAAGVTQWTTNGVVISNATNEQSNPVIISSGTGAIISWVDDRNNNGDIYAQYVNLDGEIGHCNMPIITSTQTNLLCSGNSNGAIDITVTGGTGPYTYLWSGIGSGINPTAEDQTGLTEGTYEVNLTDALGCAAFKKMQIINIGLTVDAGADTNLCSGPVTLTANVSNAVTSAPPPPTPFAEVAGSTADKRIFIGNIDYLAIGNTFSQSEDRNNCGKNATLSKTLTLPAGAIVKKAYLYWSGSGLTDNQVKLNGTSVTADNTKSYNRAILFNYFAARKDVTSLVSASGTYTVSDLNWSNGPLYCFDNSAYGGWALVVVYEQASLPASKIHVNTEKFQFTFPAGNYATTINNINVPGSCSSNAKFTIVAFEGDNYIGEGLTIGGQNFGDNNFRGQSGPNLDILSWNIPTLVTSGSSSLTYSINTYQSNTVFGPAIDGLFDYVKVLKYSTCPAGCSSVTYQWTLNNTVVGTTQSIIASQPGTYVVKATDCSGCVAKDSLVVSNCLARIANNPALTSALITAKPELIKSDLDVSVQPNPGISYFNLIVNSSDNTKSVSVRVLDAYGNVLSVFQKVGVNITLRIKADKWSNGIYFAEVIQGEQRKVVKLVRAN
jgi:hypothetical protein